MSSYQYYEFCSLYAPLSSEARKTMEALSSRASVGTHGASYVYHYGGDFRGNIKNLLLKYFDVFFYISRWGIIRLIFKYLDQEMEIDKLKSYCIKHVISCEKHGQSVILEIDITNEEGFGWTEGEGLLSHFLPLHGEIKSKNYQFLRLISAINDELAGEQDRSLEAVISDINLSPAQAEFLKSTHLYV